MKIFMLEQLLLFNLIPFDQLAHESTVTSGQDLIPFLNRNSKVQKNPEALHPKPKVRFNVKVKGTIL